MPFLVYLEKFLQKKSITHREFSQLRVLSEILSGKLVQFIHIKIHITHDAGHTYT